MVMSEVTKPEQGEGGGSIRNRETGRQAERERENERRGRERAKRDFTTLFSVAGWLLLCDGR